MIAVSAKNIFKRYGSREALSDVSLDVRTGSVFGLLGPNGAGKTTLLKALLNLVAVDSGRLSLNGISALRADARRQVVYLPERFSFYPYYTVNGTLRFYGQMYARPPGEIREYTDSALAKLGISDIKSRKLKTISKGQMQRLGLATLLMADAGIYLLDEPFTGLDPLGIRELKTMFGELQKRSRTIFINSHILAEVEQVCDEIAILHEGRCLAQGPLESLTGNASLEDYFISTVKG